MNMCVYVCVCVRVCVLLSKGVKVDGARVEAKARK